MAPATAQESIRFGRSPDISPDGKLVAFSYLGDIWVVESIGGIARPVTMHEAHDFNPVFSPDGSMLAFSSNRHGSYDVFVVPVAGGKPRRLTFDSATDLVNAWSPDGKSILFSSTRGTNFPQGFELYSVPVEGGRVHKISASEAKEGVYSPSGDRIAYVRGPGLWYRKGYHGSSNDDLWICNADGTSNRQLTTYEGQDTSPMWSADGKCIYYVSDCFGSPGAPPNIVCSELNVAQSGTAKPRQVTFHPDDSVRKARISKNGKWIVYECGADLWVVSTHEGSTPRKLAIEVHADDKANTELTRTFTSGASEFALSADERHVAFAVHGELFLMPIAGGKATRLTESGAFNHSIAWSPDSKKMIFASDRDHQEDLYLLEPDDPESRELVKAHKFKVKQLTRTPEAEYGVSFSPNGKRVAFISAGKLWTMKPDGSEQKVLVDDVQVFDYEWSPDSRWIAYARVDGSFASEMYIIPADPGPGVKPRNVTRYATYNGGITWSGNGKKLAFISQRPNMPYVYVLSLQKPVATGLSEGFGINIDWEDIHERVVQPAAIPADECAISPDGSKVAFRSTGASGSDLWVAGADGRQLNRITLGHVLPQQIQWSKRNQDWIYYRDGHGLLRTVRLGTFGDGSIIPFKARMTIRRDEEFNEMVEQSWRALREHFYDAKFHGANWDRVREKYLPLVRNVALKEDLYALISLMLGELNASHLGIGGFIAAPEENTADLGLIFDDSYRGPGLKVAEVLKRGPADRRGIGIKAGDIVWSIDRVGITDNLNISKLLNDKIGEEVLLKVTSNPSSDPNDPKAWRRVEIRAAGREHIAQLMYERWVDHNAQRVAELSKGKLGYIHIPSMDEHGLDRFVRSLYSDNFDKDAIVLDVRYNSGGFTHDQVLNYLGGKEHTLFRQRYGGHGLVLRSHDRKWTKPLVLLINNRSYSDAEIFPSAFRTLGLGKLVGQPTGGHVIGTSSIELIDGSRFRVPRTGVYTVKGVNMEKQGVFPDVVVEQHPDQLAKGLDPQLDKAVEVLVQDVVAWKKTRPDPAVPPEIVNTTGTAAAPAPTRPPMGK